MRRIGDYIEERIEEFRISGKTPSWLGLTVEVHKQLGEDLKSKMKDQTDDTPVRYFLGLVIIPMSGPMMPADGVYIHDVDTPQAEHPFADKRHY